MRISSGSDSERGRQRPARSEHEDDDTHAHSTLSAETTHAHVFYRFHPLYSSTLQIVRRPKRGDGAISVLDQTGRRLKIPVWMLSPESAGITISKQVHLSKQALLSLSTLLFRHTGEERGHDNLLPTAVDECKGGHRGATGTIGPEDPGRMRNRARGCDRARRSGRSDGSHSGGGFSSKRRKSG